MAIERIWEQQDCYFEKDGPVAIFTKNRPEKVNAQTNDMREGLDRALNEVKDDLNVAALVITGVGRGFNPGADVASLGRVEEQMSDEVRQRARARTAYDDLLAVKGRHMGKKTWRRDIEIPIIAAVNGWAIGAGLDEAMACDIIIASEDARFAYYYARRGVVTDQGGAWYLTRLVGTYRAMRFILTAEVWDAQRAYEMGMVTDIVPRDQLLPKAIEIGKTIAEYDPRIIRMDKDLIYKAQELDFNNWMDYLIMPQIVQDFDSDILASRKESAEKFFKRKG